MRSTPSLFARLFTVTILLALLAGCSAPTQAPTLAPQPAAATPTLEPPTATPTLPPPTQTSTAVPPTETTTPLPTATLTEQPTLTATATMTPTATLAPVVNQTPGLPAVSGDSVKIYYIQQPAPGGSCSVTPVPVGSGLKRSKDVSKDAKAGLQVLLAARWLNSGGLYNPLSRSSIKVQSVSFDDNTGLISVWFTGDYNPTKDPCDNLRVKAQLWSTIRQFKGVTRTNIFLNNVPFGDRLSND